MKGTNLLHNLGQSIWLDKITCDLNRQLHPALPSTAAQSGIKFAQFKINGTRVGIWIESGYWKEGNYEKA